MKSLNSLLLNTILLVSVHSCHAAYKTHHVLGVDQALMDVYVPCSDAELGEYTHGVAIKKGDSVGIESDIAQQLVAKVTSPSKQHAGGAVANVIAGMASLGANVAMVSARGNDTHGHCFDQDMKEMGAEHFGTIIDHGLTGVVYSFITPDGERTMLAYPGVSHLINHNDVQIDRIQKYQMLLSCGYMWYAEHGAQVVTEAFRRTRDAGTKNVFALASPHVVKTFRDQLIDLFSSVDILVGNEEEFFTLCDTEDLYVVYSKMQKIVPMAVITRAAQGADIVIDGRVIHVSVHQKVDRVVDTTGAGDIFLAGFLYGQTHGMSIRQSAMLGNALAGRLIQQVGARPEFDTKEVLDGFRHID